MITSEVQRKLVKSPPELWAELSEEASLARHLAELGEIRITRVEPEQAVEWEAEHTTGTVRLEPSGWGTKVTLTVNRELPAPEEAAAGKDVADAADAADAASSEDAPARVDEPVAVGVPTAAEESVAAEEPAGAEAPTAAEMAPVDDESPLTEPMTRLGFFARLFRRRRRKSRVLEPDAHVVADTPPPVTDETVDAHLDGAPEEPADQPVDEVADVAADGPSGHDETNAAEPGPADLSAQLREAEEAADEEVRAVLTSVLDRLGAAHHRPFSRA